MQGRRGKEEISQILQEKGLREIIHQGKLQKHATQLWRVGGQHPTHRCLGWHKKNGWAVGSGQVLVKQTSQSVFDGLSRAFEVSQPIGQVVGRRQEY